MSTARPPTSDATEAAVFAGGDASKYLVPEEALTAFMEHCSLRIGQAYFQTPRNTIKAFVQFLAVLDQNPGTEWRSLLGGVEVSPDRGDAADEGDVDGGEGDAAPADDELATIRL